jgi:predicted enzyme related to lactoylglutathione lyase
MNPSSTAKQQLISGVDFVAMPTHDVKAAAEFYGETLGLRQSVYLPERNFAEFETGNLTLSLIDAEAMGLEHHAHRHEVALHVDDVEAARKTLEERGVSFNGDTLGPRRSASLEPGCCSDASSQAHSIRRRRLPGAPPKCRCRHATRYSARR